MRGGLDIGAEDSYLHILPEKLYAYVVDIMKYESVREIRLRTSRKPVVITDSREWVLDMTIDEEMLMDIIELATGHSLYAFDEALKEGFITISGGHRIGIAGQTVLSENTVRMIKNISSINIRCARQMIGCGTSLMPYIIEGKKIHSTLIISPPAYGKTTLLRDILRISANMCIDHHNLNVSIIDERSEIASMYRGKPQNDVGNNCDVLDACPKSLGMMMSIRTMAPDIVGVDELGLKEDIEAVRQVINCGCAIFATAHGDSAEKYIEQGLFERYIVLGGKGGRIKAIYDDDGENIWDAAADCRDVTDRL